MQHLIFSCLESRVEDNGALFGRYLLGPFRIGQATTVATALRRSLLSEVRGIAITAVEIRGASHQYSSIKGVRESALDLILNLKQVVLSGKIEHDLPAIGYIDIHGPRTVVANDLVLPNGICCVNSNHPIATLSSNGLLKLKFVISAGKSRLTPYTDSAHSLNQEVFQPKTRFKVFEGHVDEKSGELPLYQRKKLKDKQIGLFEYDGRNLSVNSTLHRFSKENLKRTVWSRRDSIMVYNKSRRYRFSKENLLRFSSTDLAQGSNQKQVKDYRYIGPQETNLVPLKEKDVAAEGGKKFAKQASNWDFDTDVKNSSKPLFFDKFVAKFAPNLLNEKVVVEGFGSRGIKKDLGGSLTIAKTVSSSYIDQLMYNLDGTPLPPIPSRDPKMSQPDKYSFSRSVLPVDPIFTPITRVNFAIQIDDQWQEPRERLVLEVWSNGSIHPRQAIHEAATNLVYIFSLLR